MVLAVSPWLYIKTVTSEKVSTLVKITFKDQCLHSYAQQMYNRCLNTWPTTLSTGIKHFVHVKWHVATTVILVQKATDLTAIIFFPGAALPLGYLYSPSEKTGCCGEGGPARRAGGGGRGGACAGLTLRSALQQPHVLCTDLTTTAVQELTVTVLRWD